MQPWACGALVLRPQCERLESGVPLGVCLLFGGLAFLCIVHVVLEPTVLLPLPSQCCDYKCISSCPAGNRVFKITEAGDCVKKQN